MVKIRTFIKGFLFSLLMNSNKFLFLGIVLIFGVAIGFVLSETTTPIIENPLQLSQAKERFSPSDTITEDQIRVFRNGVQISLQDQESNNWEVYFDLSDPTWSTFTDTNSMDPVFDQGANTIRIKTPCEELQVGDIASYTYNEGIIIHRVVHKDVDELGTYFVLKGDNNPSSDPGKVRCGQILGKVVAILY